MDAIDFEILSCLKENSRENATNIGAKINLSTSAVIERIKKMEASGLIVRKPDPKDRRNRLIALTEKAESLQEDYTRISEQMNEMYYTGFSEEEIVQFELYLQRVLNNLEEK